MEGCVWSGKMGGRSIWGARDLADLLVQVNSPLAFFAYGFLAPCCDFFRHASQRNGDCEAFFALRNIWGIGRSHVTHWAQGGFRGEPRRTLTARRPGGLAPGYLPPALRA